MAKSPLLKNISALVRTAGELNRNPELSLDDLMERREFLKLAALTAAATMPIVGLLNGCASPPRRSLASAKNGRPVIIIGAGIAGLTAAYTLAKAGVPCRIYEASPRVGGRIFTKKNFNSVGMTCELGGEFLDSNHDELTQLGKELGVEIDSFNGTDNGLEQNLYYFQGQHYTDRQLIPAFQSFAKQLSSDQKNAGLDSGIFNSAAIRFDHMSISEYLERFRSNTDAWVLEMIRVAYLGESGLDPSQQSALNLIASLGSDTADGFKLFGDSDQSRRIRGGNSAMVIALQDRLKDQYQVTIVTGSPLVKIAERGENLALTFKPQGGSANEVTAERVICTVPFSVLRGVEGISTLALNPLKKACIQQLGYGTNGKLMMGYSDRIWRGGISQGSKKIPKSNGMVYTDLPVQNLWESSRLQYERGKSGILTSFLGAELGAGVKAEYLDSFRGHVDRVFPGSGMVADGRYAFFNWTHHPFNLGSYACNRPGQTTRFGSISQDTELGGKLLFAGEHTADKFAGFMNGGCRSGKAAAQKILAEYGLTSLNTFRYRQPVPAET